MRLSVPTFPIRPSYCPSVGLYYPTLLYQHRLEFVSLLASRGISTLHSTNRFFIMSPYDFLCYESGRAVEAGGFRQESC